MAMDESTGVEAAGFRRHNSAEHANDETDVICNVAKARGCVEGVQHFFGWCSLCGMAIQRAHSTQKECSN